MMKIWITILFTFFTFSGLLAQQVYWSDITENDIDEVKVISVKFLNLLDEGKADDLKSYISEDEVIFSGKIWLNKEEVIDTLINLTDGKNLSKPEIMGYQFDDFLESYTRNPIIREIYKVFDNHSVIVHVKYMNMDNREDALLVFRRLNDHWIIIGISGFGLPFDGEFSQAIDNKDFRMEEFNEAKVTIPIPSDFSDPDFQENQVNFYLEGETERDAVFQIMIDEPRQRMYFYTYKLVEFNNQHYDMSDLTVRYLPYGILFEYVVVDPFGTKNKGITVGFQNNNRSVIIQYYSFFDVYQKRRESVNKVFNNIRLN